MTIPPGYPTAYKLFIRRHTCSGCGTVTLQPHMQTQYRAGLGSKWENTGVRETIYDIPISQETVDIASPRCERCIDTLPREAVPPLPAPGEILNWLARRPAPRAEIDLAELGLI